MSLESGDDGGDFGVFIYKMSRINISQARRRGVEKQETAYPLMQTCHVQLRCRLAVLLDIRAHVHELCLRTGPAAPV